MKYSFIAAAMAAPVVLAAPAKRQMANIDTVVLQFALTLEHLENVFYKQALQKFSQADFLAAGYGANYYNNLRYISFDEQSHVQFLSTALRAAGQTPTAACVYNFPYTDVNSFVSLSSVLEGVGTSAYLGGAPLITNKDYLTAAGSILVVEALHTSLQRTAVNAVPAANAYGTPLDPTSVYTLAAMFIKSCPASNPTLPFTPFPALTLTTMSGTCEEPNCSATLAKRQWQGYSSAPAPTTTKAPVAATTAPAATTTKAPASTPAPAAAKNIKAIAAGATVSFSVTTNVPAGSFLTFVSGLMVVSVPVTGSGKAISAAIPAAAQGQTYVFVTKAAAAMNKLDGASVLFGPAIIEVAPAPATIDFSQA